MKKGLIIVDYQNDFVKTDGALSVPNADTVYEYILKMAKSTPKELIVTTLDAHDEKEWEQLNTPESEKYPPHCVKGTQGCKLYGELEQKVEPTNIFEKNAYAPDKMAFSNLEICEEIFVVGVVTEICVYQTAIALYTAMANNNKYPKITVDLNGCYHLNESVAKQQMQYLKDYLGIDVIEKT
ncbi:MAG: isochorismatase family protein [Methanimicrococcus sp.]|nr:isochorismatase family protein [Methanimicrococcus sp.]